MSERPKVSNLFLYSIMLGMLLSGTANTLVSKYLDDSNAPKAKVPWTDGTERCYLFTHPYMQTSFMFVGEISCFIFLAIKIQMDKRAKKKEELLSPGMEAAKTVKLKTNINPLWLAIPASCDVCGSSLMFIALTMTSPSVY